MFDVDGKDSSQGRRHNFGRNKTDGTGLDGFITCTRAISFSEWSPMGDIF